MRMITQLIILFITFVGTVQAKSNPVYIESGLLSVELYNTTINKSITLIREQDRKSVLKDGFERTTRGKIQQMRPFPYSEIETIGELEVIEYLKYISEWGTDDILIVDVRDAPKYKVGGHIPLAINRSFRIFEKEKRLVNLMINDFNVTVDLTTGLDYSNAKTLVLYCNGPWCGKTPAVMKNLLKIGYPSEKIKYYRGGMQMWNLFGLTSVNTFNQEKVYK